MLKFILIIFFIGKLFYTSHAQIIKALKFDVGVTFRFPSLTFNDLPQGTYYGVNYSYFDTRARLSIDIPIYIFNKEDNYFQAGINACLLKDFIEFNGDVNNYIFDKKNIIKTDAFIDFIHCIPLKKDKKFLLGLGVGSMNMGTKFEYVKTNYVNGVFFNKELLETSLQFYAPRLMLGYQYENSKIAINIHATPDDLGFPDPTLLFELKFSTQIGKIKF